MKAWAASLKRDIHAIYLAARDPSVPLSAKVIIGLVVAYALSPIDLIPDFIPVLGLLDDLLLLPLGIWLAIRLVPREVWEGCRARAADRAPELSPSRSAAVAILVLWALAASCFGYQLWRTVVS